MISFLSGQIHHKNANDLTLLVAGVGYLVALPQNSLSKIKQGDQMELYIHTQVREDTLDLYGFLTLDELNLFKLLISVSGIGPKTAILIIDRGVKEVKQAIIKADEDFFTLVPRLGKKNAQKIIIELKSKLGSLADLDLSENGETSELLEALESMGYSKSEALSAIKKLPPDVSGTEEQIRHILRQMNKK